MPQEKDIAEKALVGINDVFADIVNAFVFQGELVVKPEELTDIKTTSPIMVNGKLHEQERDISKLWKSPGGNVIIALLGIENQTKQDADIALRCMAYDGASYKEQVNQHHGKEKPLPPYPVITLVLYYGKNPWTKPKSLFECFGKRMPEALKAFVNDYKANIIEVQRLTKEERERLISDFKSVVEYFLDVKGGETHSFSDRTIDHPEELTNLLTALSGDPRFVDTLHEIREERKERTIIMCDLFDRAEARGKTIGEQKANYQTAVQFFRLNGSEEMAKQLFTTLSEEELAKAKKESRS